MTEIDLIQSKLFLLKILKHDAEQDPDKVFCKKMDDFIEMLVPMKNGNGIDTYEVHYDSGGGVSYIFGRNNNSGFTGLNFLEQWKLEFLR